MVLAYAKDLVAAQIAQGHYVGEDDAIAVIEKAMILKNWADEQGVDLTVSTATANVMQGFPQAEPEGTTYRGWGEPCRKCGKPKLKKVEAGVSRKTGQPYTAFAACETPGC